MRIGEAERAEAQRALQDHLGAGRLQVAEFVERFAAAADATTAAEIAALFADLPPPHPKLPGSPLGRTLWNLVIVGAVAVLALAGLLGYVIGRGKEPLRRPPASLLHRRRACRRPRAPWRALMRCRTASLSGGAPARV